MIYEDERDRWLYRFGAYVLVDGGPQQIAATPSIRGVGGMLESLAEDRRTYAEERQEVCVVPVIGVLDRVAGHWLTSLWHPKEGT